MLEISTVIRSAKKKKKGFSEPFGTVLEISSVPQLRFHHLHGRNARIANHGATATRPNALGEFNDAIVISNRPLRDGEVRKQSSVSKLENRFY